MKQLQLPANLTPGDTVVVVSPSSRLYPEELTAFLQIAEDWGVVVELGKYVVAAWHNQAGTDAQRLHDLQWALDHPTAKAIFTSRGGYGLTRIIDQLNWAQFLLQPKWCVGFSDLTPLHLKLRRLGIGSIHGTVPRLFGQQGSDQAVATLYGCLRGWPTQYTWDAGAIADLSPITAPIIGGNLAMLADSAGTHSALQAAGCILFLEEVGEAHYKLDRMVVQLFRSGALHDIKAILLGRFTELTDTETDFGADPETIFRRLLPHTPILSGFMAGHVPDNRALPFGQLATLSAHNGIADLRIASRVMV